ncbi:MAG: hypothetical protein R3B69_03135 [Candidatus Paceibacterota bacterium]
MSNAAGIVQTDISVANPLTKRGQEEVMKAIEELQGKGSITKIIVSPFPTYKRDSRYSSKELNLSDKWLHTMSH